MAVAEQKQGGFLQVSPAFWGILVLGASLRFWGLAAQSLWYDEGASLLLRRYVDFSGSLFNQEFTTEPPMMAILSKFWYGFVQLFGFEVTSPTNDFFIRLLPCGFSILALIMIYVLARHLLSTERGALCAMLLFAISPLHIHYAQEFRIYSFLTLLGLSACYFMLRALEDDRPRYWLAMVLLLALMMYSHFISAFYIFAFNVYYLTVLLQTRRHFLKWTAWMLLLMVLIAPALKLALGMNKLMNMVSVPWFSPPTLKTVAITYKNLFAGYSDLAWAYWPLFLLAALSMVLGVVTLLRDPRRGICIAILATVPVILAYIKWNLDPFAFYEHRLFTLMGAFAILGVAQGLSIIPQTRMRHIAIALFILLTLPNLWAEYNHRLHPIDVHRQGAHPKVDFRPIAKIINQSYQDGDVVAYASHFSLYAMKHYCGTARHIQISHWEGAGKFFVETMGNPNLLRNHEFMPVHMYEALRDKQRVWFVETTDILTFEWKPNTQQARNWLQEHWEETETHTADGVVLRCFERTERTDALFAATVQGTPSNVVFIVLDTLRADRLHASRNTVPLMPHLSALASEGLDFQSAIAPSSWTRPTMASLFTGRYVDAHGVYFMALSEGDTTYTDIVPDCVVTWPEWFYNNGYTTWGLQTNGNVTADIGFDQGFKEGDYEYHPNAPAVSVTDLALAAQQEFTRPYFMYVHYMDPHAPYELHPEIDAQFGPPPVLSPSDEHNFEQFWDYFFDEVNEALGDGRANQTPEMSATGKETLLRRYDGEVHYLDQELHRLTEGLLQQDPNTLFVIVSDHGEEFWEHGSLGHGVTLYEEGLRVPFILHGPRLNGATINAPVTTLDMLPTVAAYLGREADPQWQGLNLLDTPALSRPLFARTKGSWASQHTDLESVHLGAHKLIHDYCDQSKAVYDLREDAIEQTPLEDSGPILKPLEDALHIHSMENDAAALDCNESPRTEFPEALMGELDSLGYLSDETRADPCVKDETAQLNPDGQ